MQCIKCTVPIQIGRFYVCQPIFQIAGQQQQISRELLVVANKKNISNSNILPVFGNKFLFFQREGLRLRVIDLLILLIPFLETNKQTKGKERKGEIGIRKERRREGNRIIMIYPIFVCFFDCIDYKNINQGQKNWTRLNRRY